MTTAWAAPACCGHDHMDHSYGVCWVLGCRCTADLPTYHHEPTPAPERVPAPTVQQTAAVATLCRGCGRTLTACECFEDADDLWPSPFDYLDERHGGRHE